MTKEQYYKHLLDAISVANTGRFRLSYMPFNGKHSFSKITREYIAPIVLSMDMTEEDQKNIVVLNELVATLTAPQAVSYADVARRARGMFTPEELDCLVKGE